MYKSKIECLVGTSRSYGGVSSNTAKKCALTSWSGSSIGLFVPIEPSLYTGCSWVQRTLCFFLHSFWKSCKISSLAFWNPHSRKNEIFPYLSRAISTCRLLKIPFGWYHFSLPISHIDFVWLTSYMASLFLHALCSIPPCSKQEGCSISILQSARSC